MPPSEHGWDAVNVGLTAFRCDDCGRVGTVRPLLESIDDATPQQRRELAPMLAFFEEAPGELSLGLCPCGGFSVSGALHGLGGV